MARDDYSRMVVGFVFDEEFRHVLLIQKQKPDWQRGFFNGIGGKCKQEEASRFAIARETLEETGMTIEPEAWTHFLTLHTGGANEAGKSAVVVQFYFVAVDRCVITGAESKTKEQILIVPRRSLMDYKTVPNLQWIIPLAASWNEGLLPFKYARAIEVFEEQKQS